MSPKQSPSFRFPRQITVRFNLPHTYHMHHPSLISLNSSCEKYECVHLDNNVLYSEFLIMTYSRFIVDSLLIYFISYNYNNNYTRHLPYAVSIVCLFVCFCLLIHFSFDHNKPFTSKTHNCLLCRHYGMCPAMHASVLLRVIYLIRYFTPNICTSH
jgi:hypothetical protein